MKNFFNLKIKQYQLNLILSLILVAAFITQCTPPKKTEKRKQISGIYPHLAYYNNEGECGTGAVVPWAGKLWVVTYAPHKPNGSSDKLYEITPDLEQIVRPESIGGTPANRMIHQESEQLFIGPYAISNEGNIKTIPYEKMQGRHTGNARHLTDPANKIYYGTMEEGFYEVDVHTLAVNELYQDGNGVQGDESGGQIFKDLLPGVHGKGLYSGQGVMVYTNNGEGVPEAKTDFDITAGVLAEWDGENWKTIRRNQFVEVTGPGGIYGNENPETDPIWATGWDHKSVILGTRDHETGWSFYRLPKASHSYDGAHGWNTEWPRIRNIGSKELPDYLMTMHGMFWDFPKTFDKENTTGIRPKSAYLKVIGDFTQWNGQLVFGCDDSAQKEFLNKRKVKGDIEGPGQSNSNLWFTSLNKPDNLGANTAEGALYIDEEIRKDEPSDPFLFSGWDQRMVWIQNKGNQDVNFTFEVDKSGNGNWEEFKTVKLGAEESNNIQFNPNEIGEWVRVKVDKNTQGTIHFSYTDQSRKVAQTSPIYAGTAQVENAQYIGGLLYGLGDNRRALGIVSGDISNGKFTSNGYYELDENLDLVKKEDAETASFIENKFAIPKDVIIIDESSVLVVDDKGRRWRLPLGNSAYTEKTQSSILRLDREVATERDLFNAHGTFYELPAENADGFAKIRPISSHNLAIHDYASYRGMLIMTGIQPDAKTDNEHIIRSKDGKAAVWAGVIDDLWKLGKPVGHGGPWKEQKVQANEYSDPYLIGFYDQKKLTLSHNAKETITFTLEADPVGTGEWMQYRQFTVKPGEELAFSFPEGFQARWIRFATDRTAQVTAWLDYE
ncbi:hypothetical protein [Chondrinema litorale]|uniref:hypothetical protein n=1 Tax=Chondrinema litorale TaxID=2994555 RepID=UPI002543AE3E|nr:hypothetical protein [Chondrinema litorale]UZR96654.1 hypothetical protein OQ292_21125 [Chondrinema litorale]